MKQFKPRRIYFDELLPLVNERETEQKNKNSSQSVTTWSYDMEGHIEKCASNDLMNLLVKNVLT